MPLDALIEPAHDPTSIFEHFRGAHATELLVCAVAHLDLFERLGDQAMTREQLGAALDLQDRPTVVLTTALLAMNLLKQDTTDPKTARLSLSPLGQSHLRRNQYHFVGDYLSLAAQSPGVLGMLERLRTNRPYGADAPDEGAAFIYREGIESAMEKQDEARALTLALCGRAKNVAPSFVKAAALEGVRTLLDIGGGTGIYAIACLQQHPELRATVLDRPEVLKVAAEFATAYGVIDRLTLLPGDMFTTPLPETDVAVLSNILHDWDLDACDQLVGRAAQCLQPAGRLLIHDVFLNDALDGPLPMALYSASLFTLTEGRAYSANEYRNMLSKNNLKISDAIRNTAIHCGILSGQRH